MEHYDLRKSGDDIDLVVPAVDVAQLIQRFPHRVKDLWGDLGVCPYEFEIWKTVCLFDYEFLTDGATDLGEVLIISLDKLLLMKALAMHVEKYREDARLVVRRMLDDQYKQYDQRKAENDQIVGNVPGVAFLAKTGPSN
jgi:hypothetical protein